MSYHQVQIRKDGPIHGVEFNGKKYGHAGTTACGLRLNGLEQIKRRLFPPTIGACGRCAKSAGVNR